MMRVLRVLSHPSVFLGIIVVLFIMLAGRGGNGPGECRVRPLVVVKRPPNSPGDAQLELVRASSVAVRVLAMHHHTTDPVAPRISLYLKPPEPGNSGAMIVDRTAALPDDVLLAPGAVLDIPAGVSLWWWARPSGPGGASIAVLACNPD
jgi:hypothetical protein